jgi:hypothetical protein
MAFKHTKTAVKGSFIRARIRIRPDPLHWKQGTSQTSFTGNIHIFTFFDESDSLMMQRKQLIPVPVPYTVIVTDYGPKTSGGNRYTISYRRYE